MRLLQPLEITPRMRLFGPNGPIPLTDASRVVDTRLAWTRRGGGVHLVSFVRFGQRTGEWDVWSWRDRLRTSL